MFFPQTLFYEYHLSFCEKGLKINIIVLHHDEENIKVVKNIALPEDITCIKLSVNVKSVKQLPNISTSVFMCVYLCAWKNVCKKKCYVEDTLTDAV